MLLEEHAIVFEDLTKHGFRIGTPHKINEEGLFDRYVRALESAVNAIHDAGVLHVDLYSSNIMWKESETVDEDGNKGNNSNYDDNAISNSDITRRCDH